MVWPPGQQTPRGGKINILKEKLAFLHSPNFILLRLEGNLMNTFNFLNFVIFCLGRQLWFVAQDVKNSNYATEFVVGNSECVYVCLLRLKPSNNKGHFAWRPTRVSTGIGILNRASTSGYQSEKCLEQKILTQADTLHTQYASHKQMRTSASKLLERFAETWTWLR